MQRRPSRPAGRRSISGPSRGSQGIPRSAAKIAATCLHTGGRVRVNGPSSLIPSWGSVPRGVLEIDSFPSLIAIASIWFSATNLSGPIAITMRPEPSTIRASLRVMRASLSSGSNRMAL